VISGAEAAEAAEAVEAAEAAEAAELVVDNEKACIQQVDAGYK
jgi:hypothetical protein